MSEVALVAITMPDGSVTIRRYITHLFNRDGSLRAVREPTEKNILASLARSGLESCPWVLVSRSDLPTRAFRAAWRVSGDRIAVNMDSARELQQARLQRKRELAKRLKRLREAPTDPRIEAAQTPEELAAIDLEDE
jgi:hypothetical protein